MIIICPTCGFSKKNRNSVAPNLTVATCPKCKHEFEFSTSDFVSQNQNIINIEGINFVLQKHIIIYFISPLFIALATIPLFFNSVQNSAISLMPLSWAVYGLVLFFRRTNERDTRFLFTRLLKKEGADKFSNYTFGTLVTLGYPVPWLVEGQTFAFWNNSELLILKTSSSFLGKLITTQFRLQKQEIQSITITKKTIHIQHTEGILSLNCPTKKQFKTVSILLHSHLGR